MKKMGICKHKTAEFGTQNNLRVEFGRHTKKKHRNVSFTKNHIEFIFALLCTHTMESAQKNNAEFFTHS